jgi:tRNA/tmRNA/rRNA uracil-C5-methylase (TrmA/RlmC/RlmD family)
MLAPRPWPSVLSPQSSVLSPDPMLAPGAELILLVEKPAAGGRMIARHQGQVLLVSGAVPGERVRARVERSGRGVLFATTTEVIEAHPDRRSAEPVRSCGGMVYAHIAYRLQLELKAQIVADAFARIARVPLSAAVRVRPSPEAGYRMRARLHVANGRVGFYREGTHELCDPAESGQLLPATIDWLRDLSSGRASKCLDSVSTIELSENIPATERAIHLEVEGPWDPSCAAVLLRNEVTGLSYSGPGPHAPATLAGTPYVTDTVSFDAGPRPVSISVTLRHHVRAFFQANRYLLPTLISRVVGLASAGEAVDLYAGVGLFGVSLAATGGGNITAVEGDETSAEDLRVNASPYGAAVRVLQVPVEDYLQRPPTATPSTLIIDPPRTGMSRQAVAGAIGQGADRIVYVSCDVATLARDVRKMTDAGYRLEHVEAFDLFPNTAHVEALAVLDRR